MPNPWLSRGGPAALVLMGAALFGSLAYGITEEVKFGKATGLVVMERDKKPLPNARVIFQPMFELPDNIRWRPSTRTDDSGRFDLSGLPTGFYEVQVYGKAHSADAMQVLVSDGQTTDKNITAKLTAPELDLRVSQRVLSPKEKPQFEVSGVTTEARVTVKLYRVADEAFKSQASLYDVARSISTGRNQGSPLTTAGLKEAGTHQFKIDTKDVEGAFAESKSLNPLREGIYLLRASHSKQERFAWLTVTNMALVTKTAGRDILAYAVDIESGQPIPDAPLTLFINNKVQPAGKTDAKGLARITRPGLASGTSAFTIGVQRGGSRAFNWMRSWEEGTPNRTPSTTWLKTDRPIYRPGDLVQFKGVTRVQTPQGWTTPTQGEVQISVFDPDDNPVTRSTAALNRFGTFSGSFNTVPDTAGVYRVESRIGDRAESQYITVTPFRKPEFTVKVEPLKKAYRRGDEIQMRIKAEYFTGEPIAGEEVEVSIERSLIYGGTPFGEEWNPWGGDESGSWIDSVTARTNASGEAIVRYRPKQEANRELEANDAVYSFEANVRDASQRVFTGRGSVLVTRGLLALEGEMASWIVTRDASAQVQIKVSSYETDKVVPGQKVSVSLRRIRWQSMTEGRTARELEATLAKQELVADPEGVVKASFPVNQEGEYRIVAETYDSAGSRILSEHDFWCTSSNWEGSLTSASMDVVVAKKEFAPEEDVTGIIQTQNPGGQALLTVEGKFLVRSLVIPLDKPVTTFNLGPLSEIAPGAEIKVAYVRDKKWREAQTPVAISLAKREVKITVQPDKAEAEPGEDVTYTIRTSDEEGAPLPSEISLGVVDEGIYQIQEDFTDPLNAFYQPQYSEVQTEYSFPEIYLDGEDKGQKNIQLRKTFVDTAYWAPQVVTDDNGTARVTVRMPDNLTSWRATVTAVTTGSRLGQAKANMIVKKDLMARLNPPVFMVQKDKQELGAIITNNTPQEQRVTVKLSADGVALEGSPTRQISVPARSTERLSWPIEAEEFGKATLQLTAAAPSLNDGLEMTFPVYAKAKEFVQVQTGFPDTPAGVSAETSMVETKYDMELDPNAVDGDLEIRVDPSPQMALLDMLPSLVDFPYGCTEQTLSRFQPAVAVKALLDRRGTSMGDLAAKIPKVAEESLRRLKKMQHADGGWGWWEYDSSSTLMTGAVLEGLFQAREAGMSVNQAMVQKGLEWADARLQGPRVVNWDENTPYLAYARTLWGATPRASTAIRENAQFLLSAKTTAEQKAMGDWAIAALALRASGQADLAQQCWQRLEAMLNTDPGALFSERFWWGETKGRVLQTMAVFSADPEKPRKLLFDILGRRREIMDGGTREAALVVNAATMVLGQSELSSTPSEVEVDALGFSKSATLASSSSEPLVLKVPFDKITKGEFPVRLVTKGAPSLYRITFRQKLGADAFPEEKGPDYFVSRTFHRILVNTKDDGSVVRSTDPSPSTRFKSGELYRVKLTLHTDRTLNYVLLEDPLASNGISVETDEPYSAENWSFWWDRATYGLDKSAFFKRTLEKGTHTLEYTLRAEAPGDSLALPARLSLFYEPNRPATSEGTRITVTP